MISYFYIAYYTIKDFFSGIFYNKNTLYTINYKIGENDEQTIKDKESEIKKLNDKIDIDSMYEDIKLLNNLITKKTSIQKILEYLTYEKIYLEFHKGNQLSEMNVEDIKNNTYIINLYDKFKLLEEIHTKEAELEKFKQSLY